MLKFMENYSTLVDRNSAFVIIGDIKGQVAVPVDVFNIHFKEVE